MELPSKICDKCHSVAALPNRNLCARCGGPNSNKPTNTYVVVRNVSDLSDEYMTEFSSYESALAFIRERDTTAHVYKYMETWAPVLTKVKNE